MSAFLAADYSDRTVKAFDDLRSVVLKRRAQYINIANAAQQSGARADFAGAMNAAALLEVVLDDIAIAIQKEQGR